MDPDYSNVHNDLGDIYLHLHQETLAEEEFNEEISNSLRRLGKVPDDNERLNNLAYAYARTKGAAQARAIIERVIAKDKSYRQAYLTLAEVCEEQQDLDCAREALNQAKALSKETHFIDRELISLTDKLKS